VATDTQGTALEPRPEPAPQPKTGGRGAGGRGRRGRGAGSRGPGRLSRIRTFLREVVAELRKVIWPSRKELVTYTVVVLVFVTFMVALVASLDYGFTQAALQIFG
jgi:preprotein translocase subunit SecE